MQNSSPENLWLQVPGFESFIVCPGSEIPQVATEFFRKMLYDKQHIERNYIPSIEYFRNRPDKLILESLDIDNSFQFLLQNNAVVGFISANKTELGDAFDFEFKGENNKLLVNLLSVYIAEEYRHKGVLRDCIKAFTQSCQLGFYDTQRFCLGYRVSDEIMHSFAEKYLCDWKKLGEVSLEQGNPKSDVVVYLK